MEHEVTKFHRRTLRLETDVPLIHRHTRRVPLEDPIHPGLDGISTTDDVVGVPLPGRFLGGLFQQRNMACAQSLVPRRVVPRRSSDFIAKRGELRCLHATNDPQLARSLLEHLALDAFWPDR